MLRALGLGLLCFGIWLLLSGHFWDPLLLSLGVLSCGLVVLLAWRINRVDPEEKLLRLAISLQILRYWPWLLWQIIKSSINVARIILDPALPISPTLISIKLDQRTDLGQVIYANSITLTPGTVTTYLSGGSIDVHTLTQASADSLLKGEMSRRVSQLEKSG